MTFAVLVVQLLIALGADGQVAVLQVELDVLLLEAGQINEDIVAVLVFTNVGLHHISGAFAKHIAGCSGTHGAVEIAFPIVAEQIIHQSLIEHIRNHHHKSFLQFSSAARLLNVQLTFEFVLLFLLGIRFFRSSFPWNAFIIAHVISTVKRRVLMFTSYAMIVHKICNIGLILSMQRHICRPCNHLCKIAFAVPMRDEHARPLQHDI